MMQTLKKNQENLFVFIFLFLKLNKRDLDHRTMNNKVLSSSINLFWYGLYVLTGLKCGVAEPVFNIIKPPVTGAEPPHLKPPPPLCSNKTTSNT